MRVIPISSAKELEEHFLAEILQYNKMTELRLKDTWLFNYLRDFLCYGMIIGKNQIDHLNIGKSNTRTIVIEEGFDNESYSKEYQDYFSSLYYPPKKLMKRLHFFSRLFKQDEFEQYILSSSDKAFSSSYIGYISIKPVGHSFVGSTFLDPKHLVDDLNSIRLTGLIKKSIHLFGRRLPLTGLPFQEQDGVISVCATNALWSAFYKLNKLFNAKVLFPTQIQAIAGPFEDISVFHSGGNSGLSIPQIKKVIESNELIMDSYKFEEEFETLQGIKGFIYGYSRLGVPILFGFKQISSDNIGSFADRVPLGEEDHDSEYHLVTILGYENNKAEFTPHNHESNDIVRADSDSITTLICHNDSLGPYSKIYFKKERKIPYLEIEFPRNNHPETARRITLIAPIAREIKVKYFDILKLVRHLDFIITDDTFENENTFSPDQNLQISWDLYLDDTTNYKSYVRENNHYNNNQKIAILSNPLPKYIWVARIIHLKDENVLGEVIFNACETPTEFYGEKVYYFDSAFRDFVLEQFLDYLILQEHNLKSVAIPYAKFKSLGDPITRRHFELFKKGSLIL